MRNCSCSGKCGPENRQLTRREFVELLGASTAATLLANPAWAAFELPAAERERWQRELFAATQPYLYFSDSHTDARLHLGGIGTGNFEIGVDGRFTTWQLFNTLRDGNVPLYFGVKCGSTAKLLQTTGGPAWPKVKKIEMTAEYPLATLRFQEPELPCELELTAFSPFAPLDVALSSMPTAAFVFRVKNPTARPQSVSLAAFMQNPVGYDADGDNLTNEHRNFGGNVNEVLREGLTTGLYMHALAGAQPALNTPVHVMVSQNLGNLKAPPPDRPPNLNVEILQRQGNQPNRPADLSHTVYWLEEPSQEISEPLLRWLRDAVQDGATLVFSGRSMPLLRTYGAWTGGKPVAEVSQRPDIVFEDFEAGYENWKVEGTAFGLAPARGTLPNQNRVSGFQGKGLVNSYLNGDDTLGKLTSKTFPIQRNFIRFLVGGGSRNSTQVRLVVGGKVVRATSGKDNELLEQSIWEVSELVGQEAHLEIVDEQTGGWGHINIDQIEFSDLPAQRAMMVLLEDVLPARFSGLRSGQKSEGVQSHVEFEGLTLQPGAHQAEDRSGLELLTRKLGSGKVVVAAGSILEPNEVGDLRKRQLAYAILCRLVGADYTPTDGQNPKAPGYGNLALTTLAGPATVYPAFEDWSDAWGIFSTQGGFGPLKSARANSPTQPGRTINGAVSVALNVPAGGTVEVPFLLCWHYPNKYSQEGNWMGCHYATTRADARAWMREVAANFSTLRARTEQFRKTFYDSSLPYWLLDCLTANAAISRHIGVVFRIANGDVYGWEGSNGCCNPTCTHVWGYEQSFARLFPALEKEMRRIDFRHQQREDGGVNNRTEVPSPPRPTGEQPFADGHASCILKAYREALNHPDDAFLKEYWPAVRHAVEYLIGRDAKSSGGEPSGILQDDQWNTYDEALHGVTSFITGYYLAALRAGEEWAKRVGDETSAERFRTIFLKGQVKLIELCWNGEYFQQHLPDYAKMPGEVGPGCMSDQLIGQWWAHQLGLGYILPRDKVVTGLRSVYKYNFKTDLTDWRHMPRAFAGAKDKGLIICTWPKGGRPDNVMLYSDEVWTGIEYQVAAHFIYEGLVEEGFAIVKGARDRYDGIPRAPMQRNPWNEIECGGHYARAMSSWSLLLALSGWEYDGPRRALKCQPRHDPGNFKSFFAGPEGWGTLNQTRAGTRQLNEFRIHEGRLKLDRLTVCPDSKATKVLMTRDGKALGASLEFGSAEIHIALKDSLNLTAGQSLRIEIET